MSHVVLLGDSIFDNAAYVPGERSVIEQLRAQLPPGWRATLLAQDGAAVEGVHRRIPGLPGDASHLVVSVGGNDALEQSGLLERQDIPFADGFAALAEIQADFRRRYREMLRAVLASEKPVALCTVYDAIPGLAPKQVTGLSLFNDVIVREAARAGLPIVDLRLVCDAPTDYSSLSPIEPSRLGGIKIAAALASLVTRHDFGRAGCVISGK